MAETCSAEAPGGLVCDRAPHKATTKHSMTVTIPESGEEVVTKWAEPSHSPEVEAMLAENVKEA